MKKLLICTGILAMLSICLYSQQGQTNDFKTISVNKKIKDYPDTYDMSTPLSAYLSYMYLNVNGKIGLRAVSTTARLRHYMPDTNTPDIVPAEEAKEQILSLPIEEIIIYRDSVAGVFGKLNESLYLFRILSHEDGKWLNSGDNAGKSLEEVREMFRNMAPEYAGYIRAMSGMDEVSTDTLAFVNYAKKNGQDPKAFLLHKLANYQLVICGELHKRKASWDLLQSVLNDPSFAKNTGTVFLEMSSNEQDKLNQFFAGKTLDKELLLDIFRGVQTEGWDDRGMYEFVIGLWNLNQKLPANQKIRVLLPDIERPYSTLMTSEEFNDHFRNIKDRNEEMADNVEAGLKSRSDNRGALFIVGVAHAFKSRVAMGGGGSAPIGTIPKFSAGAQLKERLSDDNVYITFVHSAIVSNVGSGGGLTRKGIFDYAFAQTGNKPVAFNLKDSPFGKERFDSILELNFVEGIGSYENNFDGYIFLMPLRDEGAMYLLPELMSDDFLKELKRRAVLMGYDDWKEYGGRVKDLTIESVHKYYKEQSKGKYWDMLDK